ncbi:MAG: thioesterase family protein [Bryobacterales bacterium]
MQPVQTRLRVRYAETDQMGVVYYANYLIWMEVARVNHCRALGFEYKNMEKDAGAYLAVTEAHCRYRASAYFDDEVVVESVVSEVRSRTIRFDYSMRRSETDEKLAEGYTLHTVTNREGRMIRLPEAYRPYFER